MGKSAGGSRVCGGRFNLTKIHRYSNIFTGFSHEKVDTMWTLTRKNSCAKLQ